MNKQLKISVTAEVFIEVNGPLCSETCRSFYDIAGLMVYAKTMTIDMKGVDYVSSAGLKILNMLRKNLEKRGGSLKLINVVPKVVETFEMTAFDEIFTFTKL